MHGSLLRHVVGPSMLSDPWRWRVDDQGAVKRDAPVNRRLNTAGTWLVEPYFDLNQLALKFNTLWKDLSTLTLPLWLGEVQCRSRLCRDCLQLSSVSASDIHLNELIRKCLR